jgi:hypothetical protein
MLVLMVFLKTYDSAHGTAGTGSEERRGRLSQLVYLEQEDEDD